MDGGTQTTETKVIQLFFVFRGMGYHAVSLAQLSCCWTAVLLLNALPPLLLPRKHFCVFSFILLSSYCLSLPQRKIYYPHPDLCCPLWALFPTTCTVYFPLLHLLLVHYFVLHCPSLSLMSKPKPHF